MAITVDSIVINPNCTKLTATFSGVTGDFEATFKNEVTTSNGQPTISYTLGDGTAVYEYTSDDFGEKFNGVISVTPVDNPENVRFSIGSCEISCCIANLVQAAIDCHCQCDRCDEDLRTAEKAHLLIASAEHAVNDSNNITDAVNKYNKAKEFCTATCACGC